jgi:hypothetical protein
MTVLTTKRYSPSLRLEQLREQRFNESSFAAKSLDSNRKFEDVIGTSTFTIK